MEANTKTKSRTPSLATDNPMSLVNLLNPVGAASPAIITSTLNYCDEESPRLVGWSDESSDSSGMSTGFPMDHGSVSPFRNISPTRHTMRRSSNHRRIRHSHSPLVRPKHRRVRHSRPPLVRKRAPNANRAYTPEQADWIRYMKEDCNLSWKHHPERFAMQFPDVRDSNQGFSSRYYRDNKVPRPDSNWNLVFDDNHTLIIMDAPVRKRSTPEGRALDIPYTLVEKHPQRALKYSWVSDDHQAEARRVLEGVSSQGNKAKWRAIIYQAESEGLL